MNSEKQDKVQQSKVLAKGLLDTMIYIETAEQESAGKVCKTKSHVNERN